jgi:hypothetical protein
MAVYRTFFFKGQIRGFQIGPVSLENIPVVQRSKQKDFGSSSMFNYEVIQVYILQEFEFRASRHLKLVSINAARHRVMTSVLIKPILDAIEPADLVIIWGSIEHHNT